MNEQRQAIHTLFAGFCCLVMGIGLGRFAYTPLLPILQRDLGMSDDWGAYMAMANYAGYFLGTLGILLWPNKQPRLTVSLWLLVISLAGMGLSDNLWLMSLWRFLAGLSGAWLFMIASVRVLAWLLYLHRMHWAGFLYGGVGAGIALAGLVVPWFESIGGWQGAWLGLAALGLLLLWPGHWLHHQAPVSATPHPSAAHDAADAKQKVLWLWIAYFFEGMAYIISGTFLVAAVARLPEFSGNASNVWVVVGLASVPACILWAWIGKHIGLWAALLAAYSLQTLGMALPVWLGDSLGAYIGAFLYGATFMGIVGMTMSFGKTLMPQHAQFAIAALTLGFALGQIVGPWFITWLDTLNEALLLASFLSLIGGFSLWLGFSIQRRKLAITS